MNSGKRFVITADDYGMCREVTEAIEEMAENGFISTTNVMMNFGTDFSESKIKNLHNFSIGLHWNVTTGKPLLPAEDIPTLVRSDGTFYSIDEFRSRFHKGQIKAEELILELNAQYDAFYKVFGQPDYWNTHENSSLYPKEFDLFQKVALEKGIKATRNFQRVYVDYDLAGGIIRRIRELLVCIFVNIRFGFFAKRKFDMPDGRIVTFRNISKTDVSRMKNALEKTNKEIIEIIIHPALSGDNPLFGNIGQDRVEEYKSYKSYQMHDLFTQNGNRIVCFQNMRGD